MYMNYLAILSVVCTTKNQIRSINKELNTAKSEYCKKKKRHKTVTITSPHVKIGTQDLKMKYYQPDSTVQ